MTDPVDLNAAADSRTDAFANPPPRPRIEYEVILLYTGVVLSVVGLAALSGWVFGIMTLVLPVPGFERMAPASAVGMMLFGVALVLTGTGKAKARRVVVAAMGILAVAQIIVRTTFGVSLHEFIMGAMGLVVPVSDPPSEIDPVLLLLAAVACWIPREEDGWRRAIASLPAATMIALALGLLVHSIPTGASPDPRSAVSAQWALACLVGGSALLAANIMRAVGGLLVPRQLPWIVGVSSSVLVILLWIAVVQSKDAQVEAMVRTASNDAMTRLTQLARRLPAEAEFALRLSPGAAAVPWDSVVPGVVGVATATSGSGARVLLSRTPVVSAQLDSMAARAVPNTTRIIGLAVPGSALDRIGLEVANPQRPGEQVLIVAQVDSVFDDAFALSQTGLIQRLVQGPIPRRPNEARLFLRSERATAVTPNT